MSRTLLWWDRGSFGRMREAVRVFGVRIVEEEKRGRRDRDEDEFERLLFMMHYIGNRSIGKMQTLIVGGM
jgi:hypothetical protein